MPLQTGSLLPVTLGTQLDPQAVAFSARIPWMDFFGAGGIVPVRINLLAEFNSGRFRSVQAIYADNSTVPYQVRIVCDESGQVVVLPPFSQGFYNLLVSSVPSLTVSLSVAQFVPNTVTPPVPCTTILQFLNTRQSETSRTVEGTSVVSFSRELIFVAPANVNPPDYLDITIPNVALVGPPTTANTYLAVRSIAANVATIGYYTLGNFFMGFRINDAIITNYCSAAWAPGTAANLGGSFNQVFTYDPPLIAAHPQTGIYLTINPFAPDIGGPFAGGSGIVIVNIVLTFSTVLIQ